MSLCYDFEKWIIISIASVAISLTVGLVLINIAHGQSPPTLNNSDVTKGSPPLPTLPNSNITIDDRCIKYYDTHYPRSYLSNNDTDKQIVRVTVIKSWVLYSYDGQINILCENWREAVKFLLSQGYLLEGEGLDRITLVKNKFIQN